MQRDRWYPFQCPKCKVRYRESIIPCPTCKTQAVGKWVQLWARMLGIMLPCLLLTLPCYAEQKWVSVTLERTPIVDRHGKVVGRPIIYSRNQMKVTTGGEWIIPKELKNGHPERYQKGSQLLVLMDSPSSSIIGTIKTQTDAELMKKEVFGVPEKEISGVTK